MRLRSFIFFLILLTLAVGWGVRADNDPPASANYSVKIAGFARGTGQATVSGTTVSITAPVTDENGNSGSLVASSLTVDAKSHFHGTGTVLGKTMTVSGRLDSPQVGDKQLKTRRVVASFKTSDSQYGRIAGFVPVTDSGPKPPPNTQPSTVFPAGAKAAAITVTAIMSLAMVVTAIRTMRSTPANIRQSPTEPPSGRWSATPGAPASPTSPPKAC